MNDRFGLFKRYTSGSGFFFETNLSKTSVYIEPSTKREMYKIIFTDQWKDKIMKSFSDISLIIFVSVLVIILVVNKVKRHENK